jgi:hypothetical protein
MAKIVPLTLSAPEPKPFPPPIVTSRLANFLVHPVVPRSHSGNHIPRFVQHQSRAAPAVAFTTVPVSIRAWSEARSTAAFAVSLDRRRHFEEGGL